ncbi:hypothetical protein ACLI07_23795 (plasmid) [Providencia huaxiensis]|uniref:Uncharacterized protein n=5 Tax=Enterobacterales TaxID=91347 RepID=Q8KK40_PROVU|nr:MULTISPECIES: hypothetical protein [Enterobacterales]ELB1214739.1 hypothetical protein [Proteus mirabilis]ELY4881564.1 hypothetical protein [Morganella morganii]SPY66444.1 Uncharacterised protein [Providencia stuartii]HAZ7869388.1 hypothetical protein [Escherichia coli]ELR5094366.1 hypothetical protein [Providencia rettgeri]
MASEALKKPEGFNDTKLLIANSTIAARQASLTRVRSDIRLLLEKEAQIEAAIYAAKEQRDKLVIEGWGEGEPEWRYILEAPEVNSHILAERAEIEITKLGLFTAGFFKKNRQRALGVALNGLSSDSELEHLATSLETIFPHIYALTDGERSVCVNHSAPESFDLQIRQVISNGLISVAQLVYGRKKSTYHDSFYDALVFIRNNMTGNTFNYELSEDL